MWGREMRAGLVFVLLSVVVGTAFRGWRRAHTERFDEIVASLVEARDRDEAAAARDQDSVRSLGPDAGGGLAVDRSVANRSRSGRAGAAPRRASIDVNRASAAELERLPGIGPALAGRIVADREQNGAFGGPDALLRVRGIGPKTLEKIRPYLAP